MRIAILGTRGIPSGYGGFETFAEELSVRLVARGHDVVVYCRERHAFAEYRGVRLTWLPTVRHKYLDTLAHTFLSTLWLLAHREDVALYCNAGNAIFTILPRLFGIPVALNVDGIERKRRKWNALARGWFRISEYLSTILPTAFVTDAESIRKYYKEQYNRDSLFIPYGADTARAQTHGVLDRLDLQPFRYFLYVSRMEPENRALEVRQAFEKVATDMKTGAGRRRSLCPRIHPSGPRHQRSPRRDSRRDIRAGLQRTRVLVFRLHTRDRRWEELIPR